MKQEITAFAEYGATEVTTMPGMAYPFLTKKQICERITADRNFALKCVAIMQARHEGRAAGTGSCGWMSSQAATASKLAKRIAADEATEKEVAQATAIVARYSKQLAAHFREARLREDPGLAEAATRFGVLAVSAQPATAGAKVEQEEPTVRNDGEANAAAALDGDEPLARKPCEICQGILAHVRDGRGGRAAEIAAAVGIEPAGVSKHLRDLLDQGKVRKVGFGRGTTYFAR